MADALAPIADKLKPLIRMLSSDHDGELVAAARALNRLLKANGTDFHAIADGIGRANGKITEAEMCALYEAGLRTGASCVSSNIARFAAVASRINGRRLSNWTLNFIPDDLDVNCIDLARGRRGHWIWRGDAARDYSRHLPLPISR
jgi:hypothetical protein